MGRALLTSLATLLALALTGVVTRTLLGELDLPDPAGLTRLDPATWGTLARLGVWTLLGLLALALVLRVLVALALLARMEYAPLAYLRAWLLLPAVRTVAGGLTAGVLLTTNMGGSLSTARAVPGGAGVAITRVGATVGAVPQQARPLEPGQLVGAWASRQGEAQPRPLAHARRGGHVALARRRAGGGDSVLYTVQAGDSLAVIAQRLYGDPLAYPRLFRANRGLRQPDGQRVTLPTLIQPGWRLRVPLPAALLERLPDGGFQYVVQRGDSLSLITARFLGDWRLTRTLWDLNRGRLQEDGQALEDPALIQPGWTLRLPAQDKEDAAPARPRARPLQTPRAGCPALRAALLHHGRHHAARPRFSARHPAYRAPAPLPLSAGAPPARHAAPAGAAIRVVRDTAPTLRPVASPAPWSAAPGLARPQRTERDRAALPGALSAIPAPAAHAAVGADHGPAPARWGPRPPTRPTPRRQPTVRTPDGALLPTGLLATLLGLLAFGLWRRRRRMGGAPLPFHLTTPRVTSALGALAQTGVDGLLARVAGRMRGDEVDRVAALLGHWMTLCQGEGWTAFGVRQIREAGDGASLALLAAPDAVAAVAALPDLAGRLGVGQATVRAVRGGAVLDLRDLPTPLRSAAPTDADQMAPTAWGPAGAPHPLPLLISLGRAEADTVVHADLGTLGSLLVASGGLAGARHTLTLLLAQIALRARPEQVGLLLVGEAGGGLAGFGQLPHALAEVVDQQDPAALAALLDRAEAVQLASFDDQNGAAAGPGPARAVLVIEEVTAFLAAPALRARLDALCRTATPGAPLVVLASSHDVASLAAPAAGGVLSSFGGRLIGRLDDAAASLACLGEEGGEDLGEHDLVWAPPDGPAERLRAFHTPGGEVRDVLEIIRAAYMADAPGLRAVPPLVPVETEEQEQDDHTRAVSPTGAPPLVEEVEDPADAPALVAPVPPAPGDSVASAAGAGESRVGAPADAGVATGGDATRDGDVASPPREGSVPPPLATQGPGAEPDQGAPWWPEGEDGSTPGPPPRPSALAPAVAAPADQVAVSARPPAASGGGQVPLCPAATGLPSAEGADAEADAEEAPPTPAGGAPALWLMDRLALPVRLHLLGGLDLIVAGQDADAGSAAMAESWRLFLAYLLLQRGQPRTREEIQLAFWPDATPQQARDNFHARRKGLARFFRDRPGLPPVDQLLPYDRDTGHYRADPTRFWVDALAFEEALATSPVLQPGGHRPEGGFAARDREDLAEALALYGGPLFGGVPAPEWAAAPRLRLHGRFLDAATMLCRASDAAGDLEMAVAWAERLVACDPLEQIHYRRLMRYQGALGHHASVQSAYDRLIAALGEDGCADPQAEVEEKTRRLYTRLLNEARGEDAEEQGRETQGDTPRAAPLP